MYILCMFICSFLVNEMFILVTCEVAYNGTLSGVNVTTRISNEIPFHIKVPKCCEDGSVLIRTCQKRENITFHIDVDVLENNETHLNDQPLESQQYQLETYHHFPDCKRLVLDKEYDFYSLLTNGSLIVGGDFGRLFSPEEFCVDNMLLGDSYNSTFIVCYSVTVGVVYYILLTLAIFSMISLLATDVIFIFTDDKVYGIHKGCMVAYCTSMAITYLALIIILSADGTKAPCKALGTFFQVSYISSQILLAILCCDMAFIIFYYRYPTLDGRRKYAYAIAALIFPAFSLLSLTRNGNPAVPNSFIKSEFNPNLCIFDDEERSKAFFYIPVGLASCIGITSLIIAILLYKKYKSSGEEDTYWLEKQKRYANMLKQCTMCVVISSLCLLAHFLYFIIDIYSGLGIAANIIESCQGIFLFIIFVVYKFKDVSKMSKNVKKRVVRMRRRQNTGDMNGSCEIQELNRNATRTVINDSRGIQMDSMRNGSIEMVESDNQRIPS